ncbi:MAG: hypothetical protein FWH02_01305 [Oscillospiraceae bacterium]|nr:hypothetical protein [Oscillospiraceae bacterium]
MKHKQAGIRLGVGGSSILVIFVILTLTTFAALSLVSARADSNLSQKAMAASKQFYAADSRAEEILAQLGAAVADIPQGNGFITGAQNAVLQAGLPEITEVTALDGRLLVYYTVSINEIQELRAVIEITPGKIARSSWKVVTDPGEEVQDGLNVWIEDDWDWDWD